MAMASSKNVDGFDDDTLFDEGSSSFADQIDVQHYLRVLRKHKWPIALFTAAVTGLAGYYAYTATPIYSATSTLLIESQRTNVVSIEELVGMENENTDYYETQFELLKSRALAERVIDRLNLWDHPEFSSGAREQMATQEATRDGLIDGDTGADTSADTSGGGTSFFDTILSAVGLGSEKGGSTARHDTATAARLREETSAAIDEATNATLSRMAEAERTQAERGDISLDQMPDFSAGFDVAEEDNYALQTEDDVRRLQTLGAFMGRLTIDPVRKTKLVKIAFESEDPVLAARIANTVGEQYIVSYLDARMELTTKASAWLNERLGTLQARLDESEQRLIAFKQDNGLVDVDGSVGRLNEQQLLLATADLAQARSALSDASDLYQDVQQLRSQPELLETIPAVQADPLVQQVKIEQGQRQRELDELLNRYGERHPRVVDAKSNLASLDSTLQGHINRVVGTIEKDYQLLRQRVAGIEATLNSGKQDIQVLGSKKFELDALEREVATNRNIYDTFFTRMTEANSADGLEAANARISEFAVPSSSPVKPQKQLIIALAALASLVLSMLMAILYEQMDDTVKSTADIEDKLGVKLLGILPLIKSGLLNRKQALPLNPLEVPDKKGTFVEAVNTVRTAICMNESGSEPRKVITVTSSIPGEGKSTCSLNLAYSLAQLERVLLIDCDLRKPTVAKASGIERDAPGLSSLIMGTAPASQCIKRGMFEGAMDVLPSGPMPDQPLELLSSKRFEQILELLKPHYDRIVIDSAPCQAVSDALVLSKLSDAMVYAVKSHDTGFDLIKRGLQRLRQIDAPIAGVVITQVDMDKITSYGGDYYYQGYYDYYGYADKDEDGKRIRGKLRLTQQEIAELNEEDEAFNLDIDDGLQGNPRMQVAGGAGSATRAGRRGEPPTRARQARRAPEPDEDSDFL